MSAKTPDRLAARANVFKAMGHPTRLTLIDALADGERCVCELNELVAADLSTVSRHLAVLRGAGILACEKRGNQVYYRLRVPCVRDFYGCVESALGLTAEPAQLEVRR
jgi:DNA-binding transcriptional ArsR family regulator